MLTQYLRLCDRVVLKFRNRLQTFGERNNTSDTTVSDTIQKNKNVFWDIIVETDCFEPVKLLNMTKNFMDYSIINVGSNLIRIRHDFRRIVASGDEWM